MSITLRQAQHLLQRELVREALLAHDWNRREAAKSLGMSYRNLLYIMSRHKLQPISPSLIELMKDVEAKRGKSNQDAGT